MKAYLLVFVGGTTGTFIRLLLGFVPGNGDFPWMTFVINISGAAGLGVIYGLTQRIATMRQHLRLLFGTGLMGGYTTYSTFAVGADGLILSNHLLTGALYAVPTVVLGILAALATERALSPRREQKVQT